jgi:hypothetical protein
MIHVVKKDDFFYCSFWMLLVGMVIWLLVRIERNTR